MAQDLRVSRLVTDRTGTHVYKPRAEGYGVYVFVAEGAATVDGVALARRDSLGVSGAGKVEIEVADSSDLFFVETILIDDARARQWEAAHGEDVHH